MKFKMITSLLVWCCCCLLAWPAAAERVLYIPLDDRPVSLAYPVDAFAAAGLEVVTPPEALLASRWRRGDPDGLLTWLEEQAPGASGAVVSSDSILYGGLVPSRTHHEAETALQGRLARLNRLAEGHLPLRLYVFSTVMRTPRVSAGGTEPPYYEQWGGDLFRLSALADKASQRQLPALEQAEQAALAARVPAAVRDDWEQRRQLNERMNERLLAALAAHKYAYFVLGRDDTAVYSRSRQEFRRLSRLTKGLPETRYASFAGADEIGWVLLLRAKQDLDHRLPFVRVVYAPGAGEKTVAAYEDEPVAQTVRGHLLAAGAVPVHGAADLVLAVNTPADGTTPEAADPVNRAPRVVDPVWLAALRNAVGGGTPVALADIAFANGGDEALVRSLAGDGTALQLAAYGGWNTAGNSIGSALVQGLLAAEQPNAAQQRQLAVRYLEDWGYQAVVRQALYEEIVWPNGWEGNWLTPAQRRQLEQEAIARLQALAAANRLWPAVAASDHLLVAFPWDRLFEAQVSFVPQT